MFVKRWSNKMKRNHFTIQTNSLVVIMKDLLHVPQIATDNEDDGYFKIGIMDGQNHPFDQRNL